VLSKLMFEPTLPRAFKTAWFTKAARKAKISDAVLCKAIVQVMAGQADDLGGGVYKKRLSNNQYRSIILARGGDFWVYQYLFAKQDRANIDESELNILRAASKQYANLSDVQINQQVANGKLLELDITDPDTRK
jgi:hypothetical protein